MSTTENPTEVTPEPTETSDDLSGLKAAQAKLLAEKKTLRDKAAALEAQLAQLAAEKQEREEAEAVARGDFDRVKARMLEDQNKVLSAKDAELATYRAALEKATIESGLVKLISEAQGDAELLLPHMANRIKLVQKDGQFQQIVYGADGVELVGKTAADLVSEYQAKFPLAFRISAAAPTGSRPNSAIAQSTELNPWSKESWNRSMQGRLEREDPARAKLLRAQAGR